MKAFVTGGAGFIGSHLVDRLVCDGHSVTVYDNFSSGQMKFIEDHVKSGKVCLIKADLLDSSALLKNIAGHDMVYHLAANPDIRLGIKYTDTDLKLNTIATYNVLEAMKLFNIKKIAFASTSTIYGEPKKMPTPEDYGPLFPISLYGASKLACEALCTSYAHTFDMQCWIFRFANVVGGHATHGLIHDFIVKLQHNPNELEVLGNGKQTKSYILAEDCIDAVMYVLKKTNDKVNVFNLGSNDRIDITSIAKMIIEKMGLKAEIKYTGGERGWPGDVPQMSLNVKKLNRLGWKTHYNSKQAVELAVERMVKECRR